MNKNAQFYVLFIILICFFSRPISSMAEATEACGLAKEDQGKFVRIPSGSFIKNKKPMYPEEGEPTSTNVDAFEIQIHEVTNNQFQRFITETGYITDAEKSEGLNKIDSGSAVFSSKEKKGELEQNSLGQYSFMGTNFRCHLEVASRTRQRHRGERPLPSRACVSKRYNGLCLVEQNKNTHRNRVGIRGEFGLN